MVIISATYLKNMTMKIFYSPDHQQHDPPFEGYTPEKLLPAFEKAERAEIVHDALQETSWSEIHPPANFGMEPILAVHSVAYLEYLLSAYDNWQPFSPVPEMAFIPGTFGIDYPAALSMSGTERHGFFLLDTTVSINAATYHVALKAAHCALSGAQSITKGEQAAFALCRPPGHHAGREVCGGYCFFNNAAIAAEWLCRFGRVAILDVDYHAGNGTQDIFYSRSDVLTVSIHADPAFEYPRYAGFANETGVGAGTGFHRNFPLPAGTDQPRYLKALAEALELINRFKPKYLVVSAGMDIYKDEPLGSFQLTQDDIYQIGQRIAASGLPTLIVMEGGYHISSLGDNFVAFLEPFTNNR
jgi:acetoin utilization deacetylase AcuC-like enzyme